MLTFVFRQLALSLPLTKTLYIAEESEIRSGFFSGGGSMEGSRVCLNRPYTPK